MKRAQPGGTRKPETRKQDTHETGARTGTGTPTKRNRDTHRTAVETEREDQTGTPNIESWNRDTQDGRYGTRTPNIGDGNVSRTGAAGSTQRAWTNRAVSGSWESAMITKINKNIVGSAPAVTIAGAYLGAGLASQVGLFSSANQYQHQSMVAMATLASSIKRRRLKANTYSPQPESNDRLQSQSDSSDQQHKAGFEDAMILAEAKMGEDEF